MSNRIVIVLPLYGMVHSEWVQQFLKFQQQVARFNTARAQEFAGIISSITPYISMGMNQLVGVALESKVWDYLLVVESDNFMPEGLMERIQEYDPEQHPIVGGLYFGRVQDDQRPVAGSYNRRRGEFNRIPPAELDDMIREPGLYPVDWVGMGCTAIHRSVFERWDARKMPWFRTPETPKGAMGHDVYFCTEAARQGFPVHVDTKVIAAHMGTWKSTLETYLATRRHNTEIGIGWDPANICTSMSAAELKRLAALAEGKRVLEIGSRIGASTVAMAKTALSVHSVDWHRGDKWHDAAGGQGDTLGAFWATITFHQLRDKVFPLVGRSQDTLPWLESHAFDLVFIDGDHSYEGVKYDLEQARRLVAEGGVIALHDYKREDQVPDYKDGEYALGITQAVDESDLPIDELVDTLAILRPTYAATYAR